jgi:hypothetical protein
MVTMKKKKQLQSSESGGRVAAVHVDHGVVGAGLTPELTHAVGTPWGT